MSSLESTAKPVKLHIWCLKGNGSRCTISLYCVKALCGLDYLEMLYMGVYITATSLDSSKNQYSRDPHPHVSFIIAFFSKPCAITDEQNALLFALT